MISKFKSSVININRISKDLREVCFDHPKNFDFKPGQYVSISVNDGGKIQKRPYSIVSSPSEKCIRIFIKNVGGLASRYIFSLKKGDEVEFLGPMGIFNIHRKTKDTIFMAAGTGVAPFRSMILDLLENNFKHNIILIESAKKEENLIYSNEFQKLSKKHKNFKVYDVLSQTENKNYGYAGHIQDFLDDFVPSEFKGDFYICGLSDMVNSISQKLEKKGFSKQQIFFEKYD